VIIDRIPFPRPDDPLVAARQRAADSRGGNGFLSVSATHAAKYIMAIKHKKIEIKK